MYWVVLGFSSEMVFSAIGMNPPWVGQRGAGADDRDRRRVRDLAYLLDHALRSAWGRRAAEACG